MAIEFNRNVWPPDGRVYIESDGARFRGDSWKDLEEKIAEYRRRNGREIGDVRQDINNQMCARYPQFCGDTAPRPIINAHSLSFNQRVLQWFAQMLGLKRSNPKLLARVEDHVAAERATICAKCPRQQTLVQSCQSCLNSVAQGRKVILDDHPSQHQNLLPCGHLGEDPQVTVHLNLIPVDDPNLPAECWRKKQ